MSPIIAVLQVTPNFIVIKLAVKSVPCEALSRGHVAVGLNPPAVDWYPAALFNPLLDFFKHIRGNFFYPFVAAGGGAGKYKIRIFVQSVKGRAESLQNLAAAYLPLPKPCGVKMGIAYKMDCTLSISILLISVFSLR